MTSWIVTRVHAVRRNAALALSILCLYFKRSIVSWKARANRSSQQLFVVHVPFKNTLVWALAPRCMRRVSMLEARDDLNPLFDSNMMVLGWICRVELCSSTLHHALILYLVLVDSESFDVRSVVVCEVEGELDNFLVALFAV